MIKYPVSKPSLTAREREALLEVFDSGQLTHGPTVVAFEKEFASYLGRAYAIACSSGTTALHLILAALLKPGDEVLIPDVTFVATANAVAYVGAVPVLCDIEPETWTLDTVDAERKLSIRTKAVIGVHLYGEPAENVRAFAERHGLLYIEDAAEGLGGYSRIGLKLGTQSIAAAFSFFGNKVMTTGEGGMVVTDNDELADRIRHLRGQAQTNVRYYHDELGFNFRMTEMQAALGRVQLSRLPELLSERLRVMDTYRSFLKYVFRCSTENAAPWLFTLMLPSLINREEVQQRLLLNGVDSRPVFVPLHQLPMYGRPSRQFPVSSELGRRGLSLPTYPGLTHDDIKFICNIVA